jgi:hypothetical protein
MILFVIFSCFVEFILWVYGLYFKKINGYLSHIVFEYILNYLNM